MAGVVKGTAPMSLNDAPQRPCAACISFNNASQIMDQFAKMTREQSTIGEHIPVFMVDSETSISLVSNGEIAFTDISLCELKTWFPEKFKPGMGKTFIIYPIDLSQYMMIAFRIGFQ